MIETLKEKTVRSGGLLIVSAFLVAAFVLPSSALALNQCSQANSDPTAAQYCSTAGVHDGGNNANNGADKGVAAGHDSGNTTPTAQTTVEPAAVDAQAVQESSSSSSLPFTGLDAGVLALVAVALGGAGLVLRRMTTPRDTQG